MDKKKSVDMFNQEGEMPPWLVDDDGEEAKDIPLAPLTEDEQGDDQKSATSDQINEKIATASSVNYNSDNFMNEKLALIDENNNDRTNFGMKIVTFFIPKHNTGKQFYDPKNAIYLPYSSSVKEIVLEDTLDSIGMKGYIDVYDEGGVLDGVLEKHNLFYFVINMTDYVGESSIKYEPYIFEIETVRQVTSPFRSGSRLLRFQLVDIITSILKSHSIASLIRFDKDVVNVSTYKSLFISIVNYVKNFIRVNMNNKFEFKKDVLFGDEIKWKGKEELNGHDSGLNLNDLIKFSFHKVGRNASIWEALQVFLSDCVTSIKLSESIKNTFASIGDVLIPFFFKEEYGDLQGVYSGLWFEEQLTETTSDKKQKDKPNSAQTSGSQSKSTEQTKKDGEDENNKNDKNNEQPAQRSIMPRDAENDEVFVETGNPVQEPQLETIIGESQPILGDSQQNSTDGSVIKSQDNQQPISASVQETPNKKSSNGSGSADKFLVNTKYGGKSNALVYRHITMRDFFMPFYLCFSQTPSIVFQEVNDGNIKLKSIEPKINDNLQSLQFKTIDKTSVDKRWKNVVFLDVNHGSTNSSMLFFEWFYMFFLKVFLNSEKMGGNQRFISNVIPDFYLYSLKHKVGRATNDKSDTTNSTFDEYNSYTFATNTDNPVDEALREMGKNIASLVLLNDSYSFSLKGNIRRRPNEIMRLNIGNLANGSETQLPIFTNLNQDSGLYVYVRKVTHIFQGNEYINKIVASKVCESYR